MYIPFKSFVQEDGFIHRKLLNVWVANSKEKYSLQNCTTFLSRTNLFSNDDHIISCNVLRNYQDYLGRIINKLRKGVKALARLLGNIWNMGQACLSLLSFCKSHKYFRAIVIMNF